MTSVLSLLPHGSPQASFTVAMPRGDGLLIPLQDSLSVPDPSRPAALALDTVQCHRVLLLADVFPAVHCSGSDSFAASSHQAGVSAEELLSLAWVSAVSRSDPGLKRGLCQFGLLHEPWLTFAVQKGKRKIFRPCWLSGNQSTRVWVPPPSVMCYHPTSRVQTTTVLGLKNVTQPKENFPRDSFAKTPTSLAICVQALFSAFVSSAKNIEAKFFVSSTQPSGCPNPGSSQHG